MQTVADRPRVRRLDEGEGGDIVGGRNDASRDHLKEHGRERRTENFRFRESGAALVVLLVVEADRDAVREAASTARTLIGARLRDRLNGQTLNLRRLRIAADACSAGVHYVVDAGDRQRRLRHVRCEHDAAGAVPLKDAVLLRRTEPAV